MLTEHHLSLVVAERHKFVFYFISFLKLFYINLSYSDTPHFLVLVLTVAMGMYSIITLLSNITLASWWHVKRPCGVFMYICCMSASIILIFCPHNSK